MGYRGCPKSSGTCPEGIRAGDSGPEESVRAHQRWALEYGPWIGWFAISGNELALGGTVPPVSVRPEHDIESNTENRKPGRHPLSFRTGPERSWLFCWDCLQHVFSAVWSLIQTSRPPPGSLFSPHPWDPPNGIIPFPACPSAASTIQRHSLLAFSPRVMRSLMSHLISHPWQCFHRPGTQEKFHQCCRTFIMDCRPFGCSQSQWGHLHLRGTLGHLCYFAVPLRKWQEM